MNPTISPTPEPAESTLPAPPFRPTIHDDDASEADLPAERAREAAFDASFKWAGRTLQPFSSSRKSLFLQHRVAMGAPDLAKCMRDLDGFLADAIRLLFLCSYGPEDPILFPAPPPAPGQPPVPQPGEIGWSRLRSEPHTLQTLMDKWADLHVPPGTESAATILGYQLYSESMVNRHEPAPAPRTTSDELGN